MSRTTIEPLQLLQTLPRIAGVRVGHIVSVRSRGEILVDFEGNPVGPIRARRTRGLSLADLREALQAGRPVLLAFERQEAGRPIVFDVVESEDATGLDATAPAPPPPDASETGTPRLPATGTALGRITSISEGVAHVDFDGNVGGPKAARVATPLRSLTDPVVILLLPQGEPVIIGQVRARAEIEAEGAPGADVVLKGRRVCIEAGQELVLTAGSSAIRLDARGQIATLGDQVVSRARRTHKILGGSIQLN
jgi:hypothetical protein